MMLFIPKIPTHTADGQYVDFCFGASESSTCDTDCTYMRYHPKSKDYSVWLNGIECPVHDCRVSAVPFNRPWPGKQRPVDQTESAGFINFYADESIEVRVKREGNTESVKILPTSKNIIPTLVNDEIVFTLPCAGQYVMEVNGVKNHALHIFYNTQKEVEESEKITKYFGPGIHFPGTIHLQDNDVVYIDKEAIVFGSLFSSGAKNVRVFGGGIVDNSCEERVTATCYTPDTKGCFRIYHCENVSIEDIILTNSSSWVLAVFDSKNIHIDGVKIVGQWRYNTDGIDIVNSCDVVIQNCFVRSFDDTVSLKGINDYEGNIENIRVENCILWCDWGLTMEIGVETWANEYRNIVIKNCDIVHSVDAALSIDNGCHAKMHDVFFENIRVEIQSNTLPFILQTTDDQKYDGFGKYMITKVLHIRNYPYSIRDVSRIGESRVYRKYSTELGTVSRVFYKNIEVFTDNPFLKPHIALVSKEKGCFADICFEDFSINGKRQNDFSHFEFDLENVPMPVLKKQS